MRRESRLARNVITARRHRATRDARGEGDAFDDFDDRARRGGDLGSRGDLGDLRETLDEDGARGRDETGRGEATGDR